MGRFTPGFQLALAFGFALIVMLGFAVNGLLSQKAVETSLREFGSVEVGRIRLVERWISASEDAALRYMVINKTNDEGMKETMIESAQARTKEAGEMAAAVAAAASTDEEKQWLVHFAEVEKALATALDSVTQYKNLGDMAGASAMFDTAYVPAQIIYSEELQRYGEIQRKRLDEKLQAFTASGQHQARVAAAVALLLTCLTALFAWVVVRRIRRSLGIAVQAARRVSQGDLSHPVAVVGNDEFAALMHAMAIMNQGLELIVGEVRSSTEGIVLAADEIAQGNSDLSSRTEQQAGSLQQTAATMGQLTSAVHHNATTVQQADAQARQAIEVATRGGAVMAQVVQTMDTIDQASRKIQEIIGVIDAIAFQTNILALNAAVEAAKAGEQGRGFAVVAQEVRGLAQRSAAAAKEIKALITDSTDSVREGGAQVQLAREAMQGMVAAIRSVGEFMAAISSATAEQAEDIGQVNASVDHLDVMTQQNAALVEQAAAAAQALRQQAHRLEIAVSSFRLADGSQPRELMPRESADRLIALAGARER